MEFALKCLRAFDWGEQRRLGAQADAQKKEWCQAGMGFIHDDDPILHVIPLADQLFDIHYMYTRTRKILGIPLRKHQSDFAGDVSESRVNAMITAHYGGDHEGVLRLM